MLSFVPPQRSVHLPLRHDAGPGLHWKTPTQKPWIPAADLVLWPLPDLHGELFRSPQKILLTALNNVASTWENFGQLFIAIDLTCVKQESVFFPCRWLPVNIYTMKVRRRKFSTTSGAPPESWTSRGSTCWSWISSVPSYVNYTSLYHNKEFPGFRFNLCKIYLYVLGLASVCWARWVL